jgi:ribose 5-phosphate isomerase B
MAEEKATDGIAGIVGQVLAEIQKRGAGPGAAERRDPLPGDKVLRVALGSDHGGYEAKELLKSYLGSLGYRVTDVGTFDKESVDYPDFALLVARKVAGGECERGIMIDGAGIGSSMVCNKVRGIRAALCYDLKTAVNSREHNNANVLTLGGPLHSADKLCELAKVWLETRFAGGRHWARINKMMAVERERTY